VAPLLWYVTNGYVIAPLDATAWDKGLKDVNGLRTMGEGKVQILKDYTKGLDPHKLPYMTGSDISIGEVTERVNLEPGFHLNSVYKLNVKYVLDEKDPDKESPSMVVICEDVNMMLSGRFDTLSNNCIGNMANLTALFTVLKHRGWDLELVHFEVLGDDSFSVLSQFDAAKTIELVEAMSEIVGTWGFKLNAKKSYMSTKNTEYLKIVCTLGCVMQRDYVQVFYKETPKRLPPDEEARGFTSIMTTKVRRGGDPDFMTRLGFYTNMFTNRARSFTQIGKIRKTVSVYMNPMSAYVPTVSGGPGLTPWLMLSSGASAPALYSTTALKCLTRLSFFIDGGSVSSLDEMAKAVVRSGQVDAGIDFITNHPDPESGTAYARSKDAVETIWGERYYSASYGTRGTRHAMKVLKSVDLSGPVQSTDFRRLVAKIEARKIGDIEFLPEWMTEVEFEVIPLEEFEGEELICSKDTYNDLRVKYSLDILTWSEQPIVNMIYCHDNGFKLPFKEASAVVEGIIAKRNGTFTPSRVVEAASGTGKTYASKEYDCVIDGDNLCDWEGAWFKLTGEGYNKFWWRTDKADEMVSLVVGGMLTRASRISGRYIMTALPAGSQYSLVIPLEEHEVNLMNERVGQPGIGDLERVLNHRDKLAQKSKVYNSISEMLCDVIHSKDPIGLHPLDGQLHFNLRRLYSLLPMSLVDDVNIGSLMGRYRYGIPNDLTEEQFARILLDPKAIGDLNRTAQLLMYHGVYVDVAIRIAAEAGQLAAKYERMKMLDGVTVRGALLEVFDLDRLEGKWIEFPDFKTPNDTYLKYHCINLGLFRLFDVFQRTQLVHRVKVHFSDKVIKLITQLGLARAQDAASSLSEAYASQS
jgi:hypothetical protein